MIPHPERPCQTGRISQLPMGSWAMDRHGGVLYKALQKTGGKYHQNLQKCPRFSWFFDMVCISESNKFFWTLILRHTTCQVRTLQKHLAVDTLSPKIWWKLVVYLSSCKNLWTPPFFRKTEKQWSSEKNPRSSLNWRVFFRIKSSEKTDVFSMCKMNIL